MVPMYYSKHHALSIKLKTLRMYNGVTMGDGGVWTTVDNPPHLPLSATVKPSKSHPPCIRYPFNYYFRMIDGGVKRFICKHPKGHCVNTLTPSEISKILRHFILTVTTKSTLAKDTLLQRLAQDYPFEQSDDHVQLWQQEIRKLLERKPNHLSVLSVNELFFLDLERICFDCYKV
jgi:hypothetical protein